MNRLLRNRSEIGQVFESLELTTDFGLKDNEYLEFINKGNDGFYFSNSLHIYGTDPNKFHNLISINSLLKEEFSFIPDYNFFGFACDLFGNQFCFKDGVIVFLNIETCQMEPLANTFKEWIDLILSDSNYYSGEKILKEWEELMPTLRYSERLVPVKPFVIEGEYSPNNMKTLNFIKAIRYNATIAKQIFNMPDGTEIQLVTSIPESDGEE